MDKLSKIREILDDSIIANSIYILIIIGVGYLIFTDPDIAEYHRIKA
jgi:hypothetical protein